MQSLIYNFIFWVFLTDAPEAWQVSCQDPSSPAHEGMMTFHEYLMFFLIQVGVAVCIFLWRFNVKEVAARFTHHAAMEIFWTILPAIILLFIAVPSFILLYSLDDVLNPNITVKVVAHQWYWSYEYADYFASSEDAVYLADVTFDSYLVSTADLVEGSFRLLEVDNRLVLPINTHIRLLICSGDVLHSWAVPATGVKLDACPGRVSETNLFLKRSGVYFGQCSEICGANHGLMPIVVQAVPAKVFFTWIASKALAANTTSVSAAESLWYDASSIESAAALISIANIFSWKNFRAVKDRIWAFAASHVEQYGTPSNLNYLWSFGAMAGTVLVIMMLTGSFLAMHYIADTRYAFAQVDHIMFDVNYGWLMRYIHANGASVFFIILYLHICKALFFGSYNGSRRIIWHLGLVIFLLVMATAFIGYVLPWGQMSLWGATVITNLFTSVPFIGGELVDWIWGGFAVDRPTLMKFFTIHFTLPYITLALVFCHLGALHAIGSNNPMGIDKVPTLSFAPNFVIKDVLAFFITMVFLGVLWALFPNELGHPDNAIKANCMVTPPHIVPEWYFLPFYAILRSIPNKTGGICAMAAAIGALFSLPYVNSADFRSAFYRPIFLPVLSLWVLNVGFLGWVGQLPVESPYVQYGYQATLAYFAFFLFLVPWAGELEKKFAL